MSSSRSTASRQEIGVEFPFLSECAYVISEQMVMRAHDRQTLRVRQEVDEQV